MMLYMCPDHDQEFMEGYKSGCLTCHNIMNRIIQNKEVAKRTPNYKHTRMSVYWGDADALASGRVIENLEHRPVHFQNKDQFRNYLKRNGVREAG